MVVKTGPLAVPVQAPLIESERENRLRSDWVCSNAGDGGEVGDHQILRNVVIVDAITITSADDGISERTPCEGEARAKVIEIAFISAAQATRADLFKLGSGREPAGEIEEKIIFFPQ